MESQENGPSLPLQPMLSCIKCSFDATAPLLTINSDLTVRRATFQSKAEE